MESLPRWIGMLAAHVDHATKDVVLNVKAEGEKAYEVRLHPGMLGGLAVSLLKLGGTVAPGPTATGMVGQVIHLTAAIPAIGPAGQKILDLVLEGGLHFPVTFPPQAIPILRTALDALEKSTTIPPPSTPARH